MGFFTGEGIAIDLGSSNTTLYLENEGIVLREPTSVLTLSDDHTSILAVGGDAYAMQNRASEQVERLSPVMDGAVTDADMAALLMVTLAEKATGRRKPMDKAQLLVSMSQGLTRVERLALEQTVRMTGAKRAILVKTPLAAALGAGLKVDQPRGNLVVVLGGGTTEIAVLSMSAIVAARSMRTGSLSMDEAIARYIRREKGIIIGLGTAEDLKCDIGAVDDPADADGGAESGAAPDESVEQPPLESAMLKGRDVMTGKPKTIEISTRDIAQALREPVDLLVDALRDALTRTPSELSADILDAGICLSGGGALLKGLAARIADKTQVPVSVGEHPHEDVILGLGMLAGDEKLLRAALNAGSAVEL